MAKAEYGAALQLSLHELTYHLAITGVFPKYFHTAAVLSSDRTLRIKLALHYPCRTVDTLWSNKTLALPRINVQWQLPISLT